MSKVQALAILLVLVTVAAVPADDWERAKSWKIGLRLGGFSTSQDGPCNRHQPRGTGGLELTRFVDRRSAYSLTLDGHGFAGSYVGIAPITVSYKFFPNGNGAFMLEGKKSAKLYPWIGGGAGIYVNGPHGYSVGDITFGLHAACGVVFPFTNFFEIDTELRYSGTSDIRMFHYILGFGFRF